MPEADPIDVVEEVLKRGKYDEDVIAKVKTYLRANSPAAEATMAADRARRERSQNNFVKRFPDAGRLDRC